MQALCNDFIPVSEAARLYPFYSEAVFRWLILNSATNGFDDVVVRIQGRVFIKQRSFEEWLKSHQKQRPKNDPDV